MKYIKPFLDDIGKHASDYLNWLCDERKNHNLEMHEGKTLVKIDSNSGSGGKIYIAKELEENFVQYLEENQ